MGSAAAVGDAPRVLGLGGCWIDKHDDAILRSRTRKPCGEGGCTRICTAGVHRTVVYSMYIRDRVSTEGSAAVDVLGLFPLPRTCDFSHPTLRPSHRSRSTCMLGWRHACRVSSTVFPSLRRIKATLNQEPPAVHRRNNSLHDPGSSH